MTLLRICCLLLLVVVTNADPHLRQVVELPRPVGFRTRQPDAAADVSSTDDATRSFFRGAVESPPQLTIEGRLPLRDAVEYRPTLDNMEVRSEPYRLALTRLRDFSYFSSQFYIPSQNVDYFRQNFPAYNPAFQYEISPLNYARTSYDFPYNQPGFGVIRSGGECGFDGVHIRPHPTDCDGYEICLYGDWSKQSCPEGLHWNAGFGICDWPNSAKCAVSQAEAEVVPLAPATTESAPATTESAPATTESAPATTESAPTTTESAPAATESAPATTESAPAPPTESEINTPVQDTGKKVICYYTNWSWYRRGNGKYAPSDVDLDLCTHIIFGFATLNPTTLVMRVFDSWSDTDEYGPNLYAKVTALRSRGLKVLIALGGWNDSAGAKYSQLVNNPSARTRFVAESLQFIDQYGFDGLDLDWEYPKCWQVDCSKGPASDKAGFAALVKELRAAFNPKGLLLSAAVSPSKMVIDNAYDVPSISRDLDWIGVMTYDYHGHWDKKTGHVAPMNFHSESEVAYFNTNYTLNYWIRLGGDPKKVIMGIPLYGQSFTLTNPSDNGLNAPAKGTGNEGPYTRQGGFLAYYEICKAVQDGGWTVVQDPESAIGPYAYKGNQWVSFDDVTMVQRKSEMVNSMGIGGAMVWALDLDDFRNTCGCESYPLLKTINRVLRNYPAGIGKCDISKRTTARYGNDVALAKTSCPENAFKAHEGDCSSYYHCVFGQWNLNTCPNGLAWNKDHCDWPYNTDCDGKSEIITPVVPAPAPAPAPWVEEPWRPYIPPAPPSPYPNVTLPDTGYKVICYFTNWAWYRPGEGKYTPDNIDPALCTHIIYGFAVLDSTNLVLKVHDSWADIDNRFFERVAAYKQKGIKVSVALGGWNDSLGDKYSRLVNNPDARKRFNENVIQFIEKYGFDGLDLDWEYPKCWQVDCEKGPESDRAAFTAWVRELKAAFTPRGLLLSAAVSPSKKVIDFAYDVASLSHDLDWIGVMTYDYFGNWDKNTGHVAPLFAHSQVENTFFNANFTLNYWMELGADPSKIIMGIPTYGQSFSLANPTENGLNAKARGPGQAGEFTRQGGFLAYYEICKRIQDGGWTVVQDPESAMGPYAYKGDQWTSFDDVSIVRRKSEMVKTMKLGGAMIWALDLDDFRNRCGCEHHPLLRTINRVLREYPVPDPGCNLG